MNWRHSGLKYTANALNRSATATLDDDEILDLQYPPLRNNRTANKKMLAVLGLNSQQGGRMFTDNALVRSAIETLVEE